jgi:hypothetical protein
MAAACILMISTDLYQCEPQQEHASKSFSCAIGPTRALKEEDHGLLLLLQGSYGSYVLTSTYCLSRKKKKEKPFPANFFSFLLPPLQKESILNTLTVSQAPASPSLPLPILSPMHATPNLEDKTN